MTKIGFIGTGVMGTGMVLNLLKHGHQVTVYNRTKAHAQTVLTAGASWADSPAAATTGQEVIMSIVGFPKDVEAVYTGDQGIFSAVQAGQLVLDLTTSRPDLAQHLAELGTQHHVDVLDAPVSGGDVGAKQGTLTIMVGGSDAAYQRAVPILQAIGHTIQHFGPAGSGQYTKMANQIMIAGTMTGLSECLVYAKAAGLDLKQVLTTLGAGSAANWSLSNYGPRVLKGDYAPGFYAKHFLKDLRIALDSAAALKLDLPATAQAKKLYEQLVDEQQLGNEGTQALVKRWWS